MINTLKKSVNEMISKTNENMEEVVGIMDKLINQDYRHQININPILKDKMLLTMQQVNKLGSELNNNTKQNLENGTLLKRILLICKNPLKT